MLNRRVIRKENEDFKLTIIGPVGTRQKVIDLMVFTHGDGNPHKYDNIDSFYNKLLENITQRLEEKNKEFLNVAHLSNSYGRVDLSNAIFMTDFFKFLSGEEAPQKKKEDVTKVPNIPVYSNKADKKLAKSLEELKRSREFNQEYNRNLEATQRAIRDADFRARRIEDDKPARPRAILIKKSKEEKKEE